MIKTQKELLSILEQLGIKYENHEHPAVYTVEEAALHQDGINGAHSKNLFFKDKKKNLFLVVTLADKPVNIKSVAGKIGAKNMSFGKPELLAEVLGVIPGAVTPFAAFNGTGHPLKVVLDKELMRHELLNFHPMVNTATTTIKAEDLKTFLTHSQVEFEVVQL